MTLNLIYILELVKKFVVVGCGEWLNANLVFGVGPNFFFKFKFWTQTKPNNSDNGPLVLIMVMLL